MEPQPTWSEQCRAWARMHPWRWAGVAAGALFLVGVIGSLLTDGPIDWLRTIALSLLLGSASGMVAKAQQ
jgi:hypothetical protein